MHLINQIFSELLGRIPNRELKRGLIPKDKVEEVVGLAIEQGEREVATREWIKQGKTIQDLLTEFGRI